MKTEYNHISKWERKQIEELTQAGNSNKKIAWKLGRSVSTIGRELKRNCWRLKYRAHRSEIAKRIAKKCQKYERENGQRPLPRSRLRLAVFSEENEGCLYRSVLHGLPSEN